MNFNIFLITSCLIPPTSQLYGHTRSVYTYDERVNQTKNTIKTIREKVPNSLCVIIELSALDDEKKNNVKQMCDHYIDLSNDEMAQYYMEHNKSIGDLYSTLQGLLYVLKENINFDILFKISGRYFIDDNFKFDMFDVNQITFNKTKFDLPNYAVTQFYTVLYAIGYNMRYIFLQSLLDAYFLLHHGRIGNIEMAMYYVLDGKKNVQTVEKIGASGTISLTGEFVST